MQLTRQHRQSGRPKLNMASMIDIVFLLLIFFMCTSSFRKLESEMPTQVPQSRGARKSVEDVGPIRVRLSLEGTVVVECDSVVCGSYAGLVRRLRQLAAARSPHPPPPVLIQGEANVPYGDMVAALDAAYEAYAEHEEKRVAFWLQEAGR